MIKFSIVVSGSLTPGVRIEDVKRDVPSDEDRRLRDEVIQAVQAAVHSVEEKRKERVLKRSTASGG